MNLHLRIAIIAALCGLASSAAAATFTVTRQDDPSPNGCLPGDCSLREAVLAANATTAADTILLGSGSYLLTRTCVPDTASCQDLDVTQPLTIRGNGPALTGIRNGVSQAAAPTKDRAHTRLIESTGVSLRLFNLSLRHGYLATAAGVNGNEGKRGGCVYINGGSFEAGNASFEGCSIIEGGGFGGGIHLRSAPATFSNVTISGNSADDGGGLRAEYISPVTGSNVHIINNVAVSSGGGVSLWANSHLTLDGGSEISGNTATFGGGVHSHSIGGVTIGGTGPALGSRLRIANNIATGAGGGLSAAVVAPIGSIGSHLLRYMTVQGNSTGGSAGGIRLDLNASAGPITATISDIEFAENDAAVDAGGLFYRVTHPGSAAASGSELTRLSFWGNSALGRGGAMRVRGFVPIRHVSSTGNSALLGGSALYGDLPPSPTVEFFTSYGDIGEAIQVAAPALVRYSVLDGNCTGSLTDGGGNVFRTGVVGCPGSPASTAELGLGFGNFGGGHPVVGITSATSVLRDRVSILPGTTDVRGYLRAGFGDAGAFEFDGIPQ